MSTTRQKLIVVLGAGVHGLHAALALLEAGYAVTILSKHLPGDSNPNYCSPWSVTNWASDVSVVDPETQQWYLDAYKYWADLSTDGDDTNGAGVSRRTYISYCEEANPSLLAAGASAFWYSDAVLSFKILPQESLPPGVKFGYSFGSFCLNSPKYLSYIQTRILALSGTIIRTALPTGQNLASVLQTARKTLQSNGLRDDVFAFVNATGLGARELVGDETMFPIRSHAIFLKGEAKGMSDRLEAGLSNMVAMGGALPISYVSPRVGEGISFLGGYMEEGVWSTDPSPVIVERLLDRAKLLAPELLDANGNFEVVSVGLGLRPHRASGVRVEIERVQGKDGEEVAVVHDYGHGHGGFIKAIGSAKKVVELVDKLGNE